MADGKVRIEDKILNAIEVVAAENSITLPPRRNGHNDIEMALTALDGRRDYRFVEVRASTDNGKKKLSISSSWPVQKRHLIERVVALIDKGVGVTAVLEAHVIKIEYSD